MGSRVELVPTKHQPIGQTEPCDSFGMHSVGEYYQQVGYSTYYVLREVTFTKTMIPKGASICHRGYVFMMWWWL